MAAKGGSKWGLWLKMIGGCGAIVVGGPALTYYVMPTEEELFKKYSPDLQKRSLANRDKTQEEFNHFVDKLKEYSKSDKPIWIVAEEAAREDKRVLARIQSQKAAEEEQLRKEAIRRELGLVKGSDK